MGSPPSTSFLVLVSTMLLLKFSLSSSITCAKCGSSSIHSSSFPIVTPLTPVGLDRTTLDCDRDSSQENYHLEWETITKQWSMIAIEPQDINCMRIVEALVCVGIK